MHDHLDNNQGNDDNRLADIPAWQQTQADWPDARHQFVHLLLDLGIIDTRRHCDPFPGRTLTDLRAFALDPDVAVRIAAASSRWNWDVRLQRVLATDADLRVVLALLEQTDPYVEVCELIIGGRHVEARRMLAEQNLRTELLELLCDDPDDLVVAAAQRRLDARRAGRALPAPVRMTS